MRCKLVTPRVERWLAESSEARILNRFDQACNLVNDDGVVISLVSVNIGPGPFSMVLEENVMTDTDANTTIAIDPFTHALTLGSQTITTDQAALWNPVPDWQKMQMAAQPYLANWLPPADDIVDPLLRLIHGIRKKSWTGCRDAAGRLAGLGSGLTPAGDDVLMGVLFAMWAWHPDKDMMRLIVDTAVPRTTTLSAAFLRAAGDGEATIHWHELADGYPGAVDRILAVGATSGRDAWAGFTTGGIHFSA